MNILNKTLLLLVLPVIITVADTSKPISQLDFSSLVNDFMEEGNVLKKTINLSGKERMLTQNMTKLALQSSLNIQKEKSRKALKKVADLYGKTLNGFKNGDSDLGLKPATNKKVKEQIAIVEKAWKPFYEAVNKIVDGKDKDEKALKYIIANNEELLKLSNDLVEAYEASNTSVNYLEKARLHTVNIAGRQRMLTQKMTKEKLLILKGYKEYEPKLAKSVKLFDTSLTALIKGDKSQNITKPTNKKIINQLKVVSELWEKLKPLYEKKKNSAKELATIITKNEVLLEEMNNMVKMAEVEVEY